MPTSSQLQSSFSATATDEVVCPLINQQDGTKCRKRCLGEKRYRSMQEHIRRAHPEYYLPKLPATKESFELMITSPPHDPIVNQTQQSPNHVHQPHHNHAPHHSDLSGLSPAYHHYDPALNSNLEGYHALGDYDGGYHTTSDTDAAAMYVAQQRHSDEYRRGSLIPAANAAAALAQLHYHRPGSADWQGDSMGQVIYPTLMMSPTVTEADLLQNFYSDNPDIKPNHFVDPALDHPSFMQDSSGYSVSNGQDPPGLMSSSLAHSPPNNHTMPSLQRSVSRSGQANRPRKTSLSQQARLPKHERRKSKEFKRSSGDKNKFLDSTLHRSRWDDLIDAAASATEEEEGSRDLTPVVSQIPQSPYQSPQVQSRTSLPPPFALGSQFQSFQASPLNRALTPPSADQSGLDLQNFPTHDSISSSNLSHQHHDSADSGSQFQIMHPSSIDTHSSPLFQTNNNDPGPVQIYCAACRRLSVLKDSYACTNCICGICQECYEALMDSQARGRMSNCTRCNSMDATFKPFQLDLR